MGRPPSNPPEEVCRVIALHPEPIVTTGDVYQELGLTRRGAKERLDVLVEEGYLESKQVGSAAKVYWLTDKGRDTLA